MMRLTVGIALAALTVSPVQAQSPNALSAAIAAGQVGERYDGYLGFAATPTAQVSRQVSAVNLQRRSLYLQLAARRQVNAQVVGIATGCTLIAGLSAGRSYMMGDNVWHRLSPGQRPPSPDYCR